MAPSCLPVGPGLLISARRTGWRIWRRRRSRAMTADAGRHGILPKRVPVIMGGGQAVNQPQVNRACDNGQARDSRSGSGGFAGYLVERGLVPAPSVDQALHASAETRCGLPAALIDLGLMSDTACRDALAAFAGVPVFQGQSDRPETDLPDTHGLSPDFLRKNHVLPLYGEDGTDGTILHMALSDPLDGFLIKGMEMATGCTVVPHAATRADIAAGLVRLDSAAKGTAEDDPGQPTVLGDDDLSRLKELASEAPVIRLANQVLDRAIACRAADIHMEPAVDGLAIRYRVDGRLEPGPPVAPDMAAALLSRLKLLARIDIAETRLPQDGRIRTTVRGRKIDLRVATLPSVHGESMVIRVLDRSVVALDLPALGFDGARLDLLRGLIREPNGIILVTGPTGSGKTTTLYAALSEVNEPGRKIITVEDPVEYEIDGLVQVQVQPQIDLTFARVLRAALRHNPDIVLVGEIRDGETARIAIEASLTGHLVLATLHTNSAVASVSRLLDMGVEDYLLASTLRGVLAQRLARTLCPDCRTAEQVPAALVREHGVRLPTGAETVTLYSGKGCQTCGGSGYKGRTVLYELLPVDGTVREHLFARTDARALEARLAGDGFTTMRAHGVAKALEGITALAEVLRVTAGDG